MSTAQILNYTLTSGECVNITENTETGEQIIKVDNRKKHYVIVFYDNRTKKVLYKDVFYAGGTIKTLKQKLPKGTNCYYINYTDKNIIDNFFLLVHPTIGYNNTIYCYKNSNKGLYCLQVDGNFACINGTKKELRWDKHRIPPDGKVYRINDYIMKDNTIPLFHNIVKMKNDIYLDIEWDKLPSDVKYDVVPWNIKTNSIYKSGIYRSTSCDWKKISSIPVKTCSLIFVQGGRATEFHLIDESTGETYKVSTSVAKKLIQNSIMGRVICDITYSLNYRRSTLSVLDNIVVSGSSKPGMFEMCSDSSEPESESEPETKHYENSAVM